MEDVVYHLVPTSNHNQSPPIKLVYFVVYHLVPTSNHNHQAVCTFLFCVVYHLVPTSNHNLPLLISLIRRLFIILFLHQTTTLTPSEFRAISCLSSCSYIKPQQANRATSIVTVVYHLVPTSNHNCFLYFILRANVVYHLVPTSNHNCHTSKKKKMPVVYHLVPTSNHNRVKMLSVKIHVVYHLVPTSNHNL